MQLALEEIHSRLLKIYRINDYDSAIAYFETPEKNAFSFSERFFAFT